MADYNATLILPHAILSAAPSSISAEIISGSASVVPTYTYFMIWQDPDCGPPEARHWYATIEDVNGTEYAGPKCGATPITGASVLTRLVSP